MAKSNLYKNLPGTPGVYIFKNTPGEILYIGKAGNLKRRVSSYFLRPHDYRIEKLVSEISSLEFHKTDTAIEALILESKLIKELKPKFNIRETDDKSFLSVEITKEKFPRVQLVRTKDKALGLRFGPFTSATSIREALRILRKIFPWSTHPSDKIGKFARPCFDFEIGLCPGTCFQEINAKEYRKNIQNLKLFLEGKKEKVIRNLTKEMGDFSKKLDFENAERVRRQLFSLQHIQDVALIQENGLENIADKKHRIEGYDISNISGTSAVGSMVVFENDAPAKSEYRKFKIKTVAGPDDVQMLTEVLSRRFERKSDPKWPLPDLILVDGGIGQVNAARKVLSKMTLKIHLIGMAKGPARKKTEIIGKLPTWVELKTLVKVRDEAHRFAISYHKNLRSRNFLGKI